MRHPPIPVHTIIKYDCEASANICPVPSAHKEKKVPHHSLLNEML